MEALADVGMPFLIPHVLLARRWWLSVSNSSSTMLPTASLTSKRRDDVGWDNPEHPASSPYSGEEITTESPSACACAQRSQFLQPQLEADVSRAIASTCNSPRPREPRCRGCKCVVHSPYYPLLHTHRGFLEDGKILSRTLCLSRTGLLGLGGVPACTVAVSRPASCEGELVYI